ncbi:ABC transporter ATP-binding protein [Pannus brasiliensis CCIBt3594]|uniref:ABC transporter ATP-binding protein n=1 Tax=Pannus brasiliensis CCIBt3594 TaxID=1427578 RepID=A0AAW9QUX9_9CHRO
MKKPPILELSEVSKRFPSSTYPAVDSVSFTLDEGEILGFLGPSGCGKTTLLRMIAGFEKPSSGSIELAGRVVADGKSFIPPEKRDTGMVFQDYALFPHLTIAENIAFGLKNKRERLSKVEIQKRVGEILHLVGLDGLEKRYPHQLSGGQQQRVALARALAPKPSLILLDEPLSNLDVQVRQRLRHEIRQILKATGISAIFVTHDREEAMAICDRIAVICRGKLEQINTPEEIYSAPASRFVAEFVTQANFLPARREGTRWQTEIGDWEISDELEIEKGELMLREEDIGLKPDDRGEVAVVDRQFLGREYRYCLQTPSGKRLHARATINTRLAIGARVTLSVMPETVRVFPD